MLTKFALLLICIIPAANATASAQTAQSIYTDLNGKECRKIEEDAEAAGYLLEQCAGIAGYKLRVMSGDDRQNIIVVRPDGSEHPLNYGQIGGGGFSATGGKAEWRVRRQQGRLVPIALIVRLDVSVAGQEKAISYLTVSKITPRKICLIDSIDSRPNANEEARRVADSSAERPCFEVLQPPTEQ